MDQSRTVDRRDSRHRDIEVIDNQVVRVRHHVLGPEGTRFGRGLALIGAAPDDVSAKRVARAGDDHGAVIVVARHLTDIHDVMSGTNMAYFTERTGVLTGPLPWSILFAVLLAAAALIVIGAAITNRRDF